MYQVLYFDTYARYYKYIGEYQKASDYIDTTLVMLKDNYASDYAEQLLVKAKIWVKAGDSEKAVPLYQKALAIKDSASMSLANNQMEQIKRAVINWIKSIWNNNGTTTGFASSFWL